MTSYHGGKKRIGKDLANIIYDVSMEIEKQYDFKIKGYCEPFCGMLGVYQHIPELFKEHKPKLKYKAGDTNKSVILMWQAAQKGWKPPSSCSEEKYDKLRYDGKESAEKGFIGHQYSFGGKYFQGHRGKYGNKYSYPEVSAKIVEIAETLSTTLFSHDDYKHFSNLKGYVIYCDPPYSKTNCKYSSSFNHLEFWKWCEKMRKDNIVFISEYSSPNELKLKPIFTKSVRLDGNNGNNQMMIKTRKRQEKMYLLF